TPDQFNDLEAVQLRHLDVQEQHIGMKVCHDLDCLKTVRALGNDGDVRYRCQELPQHASREFLVVDDGETEGSLVCHRPTSSMQGRFSSTRKRPASAAASMRARSGNAVCTRRRT